MPNAEQIDAAEKLVLSAVRRSIAEFLSVARAMVLGQTLTAAAGDEQPPNLDSWPTEEVWNQLVERGILPVLRGLFGEAFAASARTAQVSVLPYQDRYLEQVFDRLRIWPQGAFEEIRLELLEAQEQNEDIRQQRDRIGRVLDIDAKSRELMADINAIEKKLDSGDLEPEQAKALRRERAALWDRKDAEDLRWQWKAERIARTETHGALVGGSFEGATAWAEDSGEVLFKQFLATEDERTRPTHNRADGQVRPLAEPFNVGGFPLMFPGDPTGPPQEVIQCRCDFVQIDDPEEAARLSEEYEQRLAELDEQEQEAASLSASAPIKEETVPVATEEAVTAATETDAETQAEGGGRPELPVGFVGVLAPMGVVSPDGRILTVEEVQTRPMPLVFLTQEELVSGHEGAARSGRIEAVWTDDQDRILGVGRWDLGGEAGRESARQLAEGFARWVSVDLDPDMTVEWLWFKGGKQVDPPSMEDIELHWMIQWGEVEGVDDPLEGMTEVAAMSNRRLIGATFVSQPAFPTAEIQPVWTEEDMAAILESNGVLVASGALTVPTVVPDPELVSLVAGAGPVAPPLAWFEDPKLPGPTAITVDDDGRIYGHLALFDSCHVGPQFAGQCQRPPRTSSDYAYYHVGSVQTAEGETVAVGKITLGGGHADTRLGHVPAAAHYDDTCTAVAAVRAYDDAHGIAVAGAVLPGVTEEQLATLRRSPLSGDWRSIGSHGLELVAALCVNVPGFPVPRTVAASAAGEPLALVAAGFMPRASTRNAARRRQMPVDPAEFARAVVDEQERRQKQRDRIAAAVRRAGVDPASRVSRAAARVVGGVE